jgi:SAM-dependent methyltransferase
MYIQVQISIINKYMRKEAFHRFTNWLKNELKKENTPLQIDFKVRLKQYVLNLQDHRFDKKEIEFQIKAIEEVLFHIDIERWNDYYAKNKTERFNSPNKFLMDKLSKLSGNKALDVGMGNGKNALYLAQKGWNTTGLEASKEGFSDTLKKSEVMKINLNCILTDFEKFDFGEYRWDLILLLYVPLRNIADKVIKSLSSRGSILVEAFHNDYRNVEIIGDKVIFETNELPEIFKALNIYSYTESIDKSDFSVGKVPLVRLHAGKL